MTDEPASAERSPAARLPGDNVTVSLEKAIEIGQSLHRNGFLEEAQEVYRQILDAKPGQTEALHFLGVVLHQLGQSDEGERLILAALETAPKYIDAISNLGNIYVNTERYNQAAELYHRAIEVNPDFVDAHLNLATLYHMCGRYEEAIAEWEQAMKLSPEFSEHHAITAKVDQSVNPDSEGVVTRGAHPKQFRIQIYESMAHSLTKLKRVEQAAEVLRQWLDAEPDDPKPRHHLAGLTGIDVPHRASNDYIKKVFDRFAETFDSQLEKLEYATPARAVKLVNEELGQARANLSILDAGCGTGLCAAGIRPFAKRLTGVDLSSEMLDHARKRELYDELVESELTEYLLRSPQSFDLILSTDVLIYFGALSDVIQAAAVALRPEGRIVFSLESANEQDAPNGYHLQSHGRYRHTQEYVRKVMQQASLEVISIRDCFLRMESRLKVMGWLVVGRATRQGWKY